MIVGITNQAGVHYGHKTLEDCVTEQQITMKLLPQINCILACPNLGDSMVVIYRDSWSLFNGKFKDTRSEEDKKNIPAPPAIEFDSFRKPGIGMIQYFLNTHKPFSEALFIGDMDSDRQAAERSNIPFMWAKDWRNE